MSPPRTLPFDRSVPVSTGSSPASSMDATQLINFLREYRVLECSCCSTAFGFQHKSTGLLYCVQGCHERSPGSPLLPQSPNLVVSTYSPPIGPMKINTLGTTVPNGIYVGNGGGVPRGVTDTQQTVIKPLLVTSMEPSITQVVNPLSSAPKKPTSELPMQAKIERTEFTPSPVMPLLINDAQQSKPKPATEKVSPAVRNETAAQPQRVKTNVNIPAPAPSTSVAPRVSADVTDAGLKESKSAGLKSVRVKPNSDVELSLANIPWPDLGSLEPIICSLGFDCGDGSFFVQPLTPAFIKFGASVRNKIVELIRSGKCNQLAHPAVGSLCLAPFEGEHYRAEIISGEANGKWRVFFIDYGNTETMGNLDLLGIPDELKEEPRLCVFGYWDQVLAGTKKAEELFETCYDADTETIRVVFFKKITNGQYVFQIGEPAKATFMIERSSTPSQPKSPTVPQWRDCTYSANLKSNEAVHIVHVWDATTFQVIADADEGALTAFQALIKKFASDEAKPLTRPPVLNEIVIAQYQGEYYRGKVDSVDGNNCTCNFLDYGDSKESKISDVLPVNDAIMKYPIYGMTIRLDKVPAQPEGFAFDEPLEELVYNSGFILDLVQNANIKPADVPHYDARLWDPKKENTLNDAVKAALLAFRSKS